VSQAYPVHIVREIEHRWQRRFQVIASPASPAAQNDNDAGDGPCPICMGYASIGPNAAEYCGEGLVRRHWLCRACSHEWVTVFHVPA
jgi:hypothetical protein